MNCELVYATEYEEFFYTDSDLPVSAGQIIGVEVDTGNEVELVLLDDIYWSLSHEES